MKRSKFSEAQVAFILRQAEEGASVGEVCRKAGISEATFYVWRKKCAGLMPSEMKRLRQLEDENARLKRIKALAETRVRCGYRRITVLLKREGWAVTGKRLYRLYKELGLQLRNKTPKRKVKAKLCEDRQPASGPKDVWAMDFLHDQLFGGRKIRILAVIDTFSRFSPALDRRFPYKASDVVQTLERAGRRTAIRGSFEPTMARSLSPATWSSGPIRGASPWTSVALASRPTTPSPSPPTARFEPSA